MYLTKGAAHVTDTRVDLRLSDPAGWPGLGDDLAYTVVLLGDQERGPLLFFTSVAPGIDVPFGEAHAHASDNFRVVMRGELTMGRTTYGPGHFRFQRGWRPYPSDNQRHGSRVVPAATASR